MFQMPGMGEWFIILLIVLVIFGAGKLPQIGKQLGSAISEFKNTVNNPKKDEEEKPTEGGNKTA